MPTWKRNLYVLCVVQLLTLTGFSAYGSFIAYYVQELGASTFAEATSWMAAFQTGGGIAMMVAAPVWGTLADRYGRKMMLIRATGAGCILAFLMSIAQTPMQLTIIRVAQGAFCGTVSAAMTMVATGTPEEHLGSSMGLMQMVQFISGATGPVLGGLAADALGYRAVFPLSSALMAVSVVLLVALVRERFVAPKRQAPAERGQPRPRAPSVLTRNSGSLLLAMTTMSFAMAVLMPIISLYIQALNPDEAHLATLAGAVSSVAAVTSSLAAVAVGRMGDKLGQKTILLVCSVGVALIHIPQAFVSNAMQLVVLRAIQGLFIGGMMPTTNALLAKSTHPSKRGTIFGLSTSVQSGGSAVGPVVGAAAGNAWGMPSVFLITAGTFVLVAAMVAKMVRPQPVVAAEEAPAPAAVRS